MQVECKCRTADGLTHASNKRQRVSSTSILDVVDVRHRRRCGTCHSCLTLA